MRGCDPSFDLEALTSQENMQRYDTLPHQSRVQHRTSQCSTVQDNTTVLWLRREKQSSQQHEQYEHSTQCSTIDSSIVRPTSSVFEK